MTEVKTCLNCGKSLTGEQKKYCSMSCGNSYRKRHDPKYRERERKRSQERRKDPEYLERERKRNRERGRERRKDPEYREQQKRIAYESYHKKRPVLQHRGNKPKHLNGHSRRGDNLLIIRDKGGCYTCCRLKGTILNTYTNQIVAICEEQQIQHAPHPRDGCHLLEPYSSSVSDFRPRNKKRRQRMNIEIKQGDWHGIAKQRRELGIDGWEVVIFHKNAIAYREFHCEVYPEEEIRQAILDYINKEVET